MHTFLEYLTKREREKIEALKRRYDKREPYRRGYENDITYCDIGHGRDGGWQNYAKQEASYLWVWRAEESSSIFSPRGLEVKGPIRTEYENTHSRVFDNLGHRHYSGRIEPNSGKVSISSPWGTDTEEKTNTIKYEIIPAIRQWAQSYGIEINDFYLF